MKITRDIGGYKYTTELTPTELELAWGYHQQELDRKYIDTYLEENGMFSNLEDTLYYKIVETIRSEMKRICNVYKLPQQEAIVLATALATKVYANKI